MNQTYMIIERYKTGRALDLYRRFDEQGRMLPEGVVYLGSWIDEAVETCFQLMESESREKLNDWIENWEDLAEFEVVPVIDSAEARKRVFGL